MECILIFLGVIVIIKLIILLLTTKYQKNARVSCRWCKQWFDLYEDVDSGATWYEPTGEDLQGKCICRYIIGK